MITPSDLRLPRLSSRVARGLQAAAIGVLLLVDVFGQLQVGLPVTGLLTVLVGAVVGGCALAMRRAPVALVAVGIGVSLLASLLSVVLLVVDLVAGLPLDADELQVFFPSLAEAFGLAIIVVAGLRAAPPPRAWAIAAGAGVALLASPLLRLPGGEGLAVLAALGWGAAVAVGLLLRAVDERRAVAVRTTQTDERMELARELHDVVAHDVTGIVVQAQAGQLILRDDPDRAVGMLADIEQAGATALESMRRIVGVLRRGTDAERAPHSGLANLPALTERFAATGPTVRLDLDEGLSDATLPAGIGAAVFRVAQEALTNARRHAPELSTVDVTVRSDGHGLRLHVRNDGVTHAERSTGSGGFGLVGMTERVHALGGQLAAGPDGPDSWLVWAVLPVRPAEGGAS